MKRFLALLLAVCVASAPIAASASAFSSAVIALSPTAYYRLDESSGTSVSDSSGHGYNGTISTPSTISLGVAGLVIGDADTAYNFTSTASGIVLSPLPTATNTTMFALVSGTYTGGFHSILNYRRNICGVDAAHPAMGFPAGPTYYADSTQTLTNGTPYVIACEFVGNTIYTSVNGSAWKELSASVGFETGGSSAIGYLNASNPAGFAGTIDEVAIFPYALSQSQLNSLVALAGYGLVPGSNIFFGSW
jgi:hypothetical protein